jgi:VanZ family protein
LAWRWRLWWLVTALWAVALLTPQPADASEVVLPAEARYPSAKLLHISAYAFLAFTAAWLPPWRPFWLLPWLVLSLHGIGTEFFQQWVPRRHGCWQDVVFDHCGIALGVLAAWLWHRSVVKSSAASAEESSPDDRTR